MSYEPNQSDARGTERKLLNACFLFGFAAVILAMATLKDGPFARTARQLDPVWHMQEGGKAAELQKNLRSK